MRALRRTLCVGLSMWVLTFAAGAHGKTASTFRGELLQGGGFSLDEARVRDKSVLLCFWATWCGPCLEELRQLKLKLRDASLPLDVVSVNVDNGDTASDVRSVVRQQEIGFPVLLDPRQEIFSQFQLSRTLPFSVLIGPKLQVLETFSGYSENMLERLRAHLSIPPTSREVTSPNTDSAINPAFGPVDTPEKG